MTSPRQRLIDAAADLFYRHGCHATGIDTVIARAGVAKMTLYKHFPSKEALVEAVVGHLDELFRGRYATALEAGALGPTERLLGLFQVVEEWTRSGDFCGCPFVNICAEYADHDSPVHGAAARNKAYMLEVMTGLTQAAGAADPAGLARQLQILLEGSVALAQVTGQASRVGDAREAARVLIAAALPPGASAVCPGK